MTDAEKAELEQAEFLKLKLLVKTNISYFKDFTGEEQVKYIDGLDYEEGSEFLYKNSRQLKKDAPAPKNKYRMDRDLIKLFVERKYPFNHESIFLGNIGCFDFSQTNIGGKQFCHSWRAFGCKLPKGMDFTGCSFLGKDISCIDFSETNITGEQLISAKNFSECKVPSTIDFKNCVLDGVKFLRIDFTKTDIKKSDLSKASKVLGCKFKKSVKSQEDS